MSGIGAFLLRGRAPLILRRTGAGVFDTLVKIISGRGSRSRFAIGRASRYHAGSMTIFALHFAAAFPLA
jgi:hypothetical protein